MPHFSIELNDDGTTREIFRDGQPHQESLTLGQLYSVVTIYFNLAASNLSHHSREQTKNGRRSFGLQSFLMSLTGLEAFSNTYFRLRSQQLENDAIRERLAETRGALSHRIRDLLALTPEGPIQDQAPLLTRIHALSQLRNEIVHPRWEPSSLSMEAGSVVIGGLVESRQALFEDHQFCREALLWCLLVIARIAVARGHEDISGFMFHWTGNYNMSLPNLLHELGLPAPQ